MKQVIQGSQESAFNLSSQQKKTDLYECISKSFIANPNSNKLVFMSPSVPIIPSLSLSLIDAALYRKQIMTILIDFEAQQLDLLSETIKMQILQDPSRAILHAREELQITRLGNLTIQKRKMAYLKKGIGAVSCQVFLTDLLRGSIVTNPKFISKIIVRLNERVKDKYNYYAWLITLLKIKCQNLQQHEKSTVILISTSPHHCLDGKELQRVYRTLFCKKIVIWPFGRSQIHKQLSAFRMKNSIKQWEHTLPFSEGQRELHNLLMKLFNIIKKKYCSKHGQKMTLLDDVLYSRSIQDSYRTRRGDLAQFQNVKTLIIGLQNVNKLKVLDLLSTYIDEKPDELWNSSNMQLMELIQQIQNKLKGYVSNYQKNEARQVVNIFELLRRVQEAAFSFNLNEEQKYVCRYQLQLGMKIFPEVNQKINQILKIIQNSRATCQLQRKDHDGQDLEEGLDQLQKRLKIQNDIKYKNILIICSRKGIVKQIKNYLKNYRSSTGYMGYLLSLYNIMKRQRPQRLAKIKKIYQKNKTKKQQGLQIKPVVADRKHWVEQNKVVLQETLFGQLQRLNQIIGFMELQLAIIQNQKKEAIQLKTKFQAAQAEAKLKQSFADRLKEAKFKIIDESKIQFYNRSDDQDVYFDGVDCKVNVIVDQQYQTMEPTHFYSLVDIYQPQTIIFYSPSTNLLRSLYIHQIQSSSNLKDIHVVSYQDSYQSKSTVFEVTKEDKAFWSISQNRNSLHQFFESPYLRIQSLNMRDNYEIAHNRITQASFLKVDDKINQGLRNIELQPYKRRVIVDTRQFKSSLPSYLYHSGFEVIPMFLKVADYILSDDVAVQKKSVHTGDLRNSLKSGRLQDQLRRLLHSFKRAYLLIECQQETDCIKSNFGYIDGMSGPKGRYQMRRKLIDLVKKYPRIRLIWSTSALQTCRFIQQLKKDRGEPDLQKYAQKEDENNFEDKSGQLGTIQQVSQKQNSDD